MDFQIQPPQQLPEAPPAIRVQVEATDPHDEMVQRFFDSAARAFEEWQLAGKSEDEIIQFTAGLVIQILTAQSLRIDDRLMQAFYKQKAIIQAAFPKPTIETVEPEPKLSILARTRIRIRESLRWVLI